MPSGPISFSTLANATGENTIDTTNLPPSVLQAGTNVIAVEIHQQALTSSDLSFDLELIANPAPPPPRLESSLLNGELVLYWSDPTFTLEHNDNLAAPSWTSLAAPSPIPIIPTIARQFFRLRK